MTDHICVLPLPCTCADPAREASGYAVATSGFLVAPACSSCGSIVGDSGVCANCGVVERAAAVDLITVRGIARADEELARDPAWLQLVEQARANGWVR